MAVKFPYAGQSFTIKMDNGLEVKTPTMPVKTPLPLSF